MLLEHILSELNYGIESTLGQRRSIQGWFEISFSVFLVKPKGHCDNGTSGRGTGIRACFHPQRL